ncbi:MAG: hypothetical protein JXB44_02240 [Calditrichaceae bacterium]|nr:hypothetical protein [Calditrichaceae bacterium]RQV97193.1 MAG: hypothetical protein EH224_02180 [Calditrichota bacterium]
MLKDSGVKALVSKQFGKNIQIVNRHFIPIIIYNENPMELLPVLKDYVKKIENALNNNHEAFKTCIIKNGEFKTIIKNNNFMG